MATRDGVTVSVALPARENVRDALPTVMRIDRDKRALARTVVLPAPSRAPEQLARAASG